MTHAALGCATGGCCDVCSVWGGKSDGNHEKAKLRKAETARSTTAKVAQYARQLPKTLVWSVAYAASRRTVTRSVSSALESSYFLDGLWCCLRVWPVHCHTAYFSSGRHVGLTEGSRRSLLAEPHDGGQGPAGQDVALHPLSCPET